MLEVTSGAAERRVRKNMKKITLILPEGYDQVISVTAIGVTIHFATTVTNVITKAYEIENNGVYVVPTTKEVTNNG